MTFIDFILDGRGSDNSGEEDSDDDDDQQNGTVEVSPF